MILLGFAWYLGLDRAKRKFANGAARYTPYRQREHRNYVVLCCFHVCSLLFGLRIGFESLRKLSLGISVLRAPEFTRNHIKPSNGGFLKFEGKSESEEMSH